MKFYAVEHICGGWSVGTKKECGIALEPEKVYTKEEANRAVEIANRAIAIYEYKPNHEYCD